MPKQVYSIVGGLNENMADPLSRPIEFSVLVNAVADKKIGALIKRRGSTTETITNGLGVPIGIGEYLAAATSGLLPVTKTLLVNFAGADFYKLSGSTWSSVTDDSNTSFDSSKQNSNSMFQELWIAGGRPAHWAGGTNRVERVGIPAPVAAITHAVSGAGGITGSYKYMYTYYRSSDGLESDWNPISTTASPVAQQVDLTIPNTAASAYNVDQKRIYRTFNGGSTYHLLTTVTVATTTYADTTTDANLGAASADYGEYGLPPTNSFVNESFNSRVWWVDASNHYKLAYSKPYTGSNVDLQYFPASNYVILSRPITGLKAVGRRLLVFHPRGISIITGYSDEDLSTSILHDGVGTLFHGSVSSDGDRVLFLSEQGWHVLEGDSVRLISRPIDYKLQAALNQGFDDDLYVSSIWNPAMRQFIMMISGSSDVGAPWVTSGTGTVAQWEDSSTGADADWEDSAAPGTEEYRQVLFWGWSPETSLFAEYKFAQFEDGNDDTKYPTHMLHPLPSSDTLDPQQDKTFILYFNGTQGAVLGAFDSSTSRDDSTAVEAVAITGRIEPGQQGNFKRVLFVEFEGAYGDNESDGTGEIKYLKEFDDPQERDYSSNLLTFTGDGDHKVPEEGLMRYMRLYFRDNSTTQEKILVQRFKVHFRERNYRESR